MLSAVTLNNILNISKKLIIYQLYYFYTLMGNGIQRLVYLKFLIFIIIIIIILKIWAKPESNIFIIFFNIRALLKFFVVSRFDILSYFCYTILILISVSFL